ncbi:metal ABC transporter ATP-binding protein [soil metagenome]
MTSLTIEHLTVRYGHILALDDVDLTIPGGSVTGLIGPNGGGKSTLIKAIAGEVADVNGSLRFGGQPLDRSRTRIAYVPQARAVNWDFPLSARDLVMMGLYRDLGWFRRPSQSENRRVEQALSRLGMEGMGDRHISQFSGGQQQRLFLARAIVQYPDIVLLDEPMTGLDLTTRDIIHQMVEEFVENGAAVILASHDLDEIRQLSDQLVCLNRRVIAAGATSEAFSAENLKKTFGGRIAVFDAA